MTTTTTKATTTTLFCLVLGDNPTKHAFPVEVSENDTIGKLKELIKTKKAPEFDDIAADKLTLWQVDIPREELITLGPDIDIQTLNGVELSPLMKISKAFNFGDVEEKLHIITTRPVGVIVANQSKLNTRKGFMYLLSQFD